MCIMGRLVHLFQHADLGANNISMAFAWPPRGLYSRPFRIDKFGDMLREASQDDPEGPVDIDAYNTYVLGDCLPEYGFWPKCYSSFLDPKSRYKDLWAGCYFVLDDAAGKGRRFFMQDPEQGDPADWAQIKPDAVKRLPQVDQKMIFMQSHDGQKPAYTREDLARDFYFRLKPGTHVEHQFVNDSLGQQWIRLSATYQTRAALTDTSKTKMCLATTLRAYTNLPGKEVYDLVEAWHEVELGGHIWLRYFASEYGQSFWAVFYVNGSAFTRLDGVQVDNWNNGPLQSEMLRLFDETEIMQIIE